MNLAATLEWFDLVTELAAPHSIEPALILAIIWMESRGNPDAYNDISKATGLMQVVPCEAGPPFEDRPSIAELKDPRTNIEWGIKVLRYFQNKAKGDLWTALYRYSGGAVWPSTQDFTKRYWKKYLSARRGIRRALMDRKSDDG